MLSNMNRRILNVWKIWFSIFLTYEVNMQTNKIEKRFSTHYTSNAFFWGKSQYGLLVLPLLFIFLWDIVVSLFVASTLIWDKKISFLNFNDVFLLLHIVGICLTFDYRSYKFGNFCENWMRGNQFCSSPTI